MGLQISRRICAQILEGHMVQDHLLIQIPPKYAVSEVIGYLKGKSAIAVARQFSGRKKNLNGESFWARGYAVSTLGFEEAQIRGYIRTRNNWKGKALEMMGRFK